MKETDGTIATNCDKCDDGNKQSGIDIIQQDQGGLSTVGGVIREGLSEDFITSALPFVSTSKFY